MSQLARGKVGRNERCPCGSGKKYKRCCLPRDEAVAMRDIPRPPTVREARDQLRHLASPTVDSMRRHIDTLEAALEAGGPLAHLRFDLATFARVVDEHAPTIAAMEPRVDGQTRLEHLMDLCYPELATETWMAHAEATLLRAVHPGAALSPLTEAALLAAATLRRSGETLAEPVPGLLALALFPVQLRESIEQVRVLDAATADLAPGFDARGVPDLAALRRANPAAFDEVAARLEGSPALRRHLEGLADGVLRRTGNWLEGDEAPDLFTLDQSLVAMAAFVRARAVATDPDCADELVDLLPSALEGTGLVETLAERCDAELGATTGAEQDRWRELKMCLALDPVPVVIEALKGTRRGMAFRSEAEVAWLDANQSRRNQLEVWIPDYADWLREAGEPDAAAALLAALPDLVR